jgi:hypothetical protein
MFAVYSPRQEGKQERGLLHSGETFEVFFRILREMAFRCNWSSFSLG